MIMSAFNAHSQSIWNTPAACLGQKPPTDTPEIFALHLLTQKDTFAFDRVAFSADGREFYYPTNTTWFSCKDHTWTNPVSLGPLINNGTAHRWGEYVTPDGKYLFYSYGTSPGDCHIYWLRFDHLLEKLRRENL